MGKVNYVLVNAEILPPVYKKVLTAKKLIATGKATSVTSATKMAGISRSAYYKYSRMVFEYDPESADEFETIELYLDDEKGALSAVMNEVYLVSANVLEINQEAPQNGVARVVLTVRITEMTVSFEQLLNSLNEIKKVRSIMPLTRSFSISE